MGYINIPIYIFIGLKSLASTLKINLEVKNKEKLKLQTSHVKNKFENQACFICFSV